jgi:hypothetical protein
LFNLIRALLGATELVPKSHSGYVFLKKRPLDEVKRPTG